MKINQSINHLETKSPSIRQGFRAAVLIGVGLFSLLSGSEVEAQATGSDEVCQSYSNDEDWPECTADREGDLFFSTAKETCTLTCTGVACSQSPVDTTLEYVREARISLGICKGDDQGEYGWHPVKPGTPEYKRLGGPPSNCDFHISFYQARARCKSKVKVCSGCTNENPLYEIENVPISWVHYNCGPTNVPQGQRSNNAILQQALEFQEEIEDFNRAAFAASAAYQVLRENLADTEADVDVDNQCPLPGFTDEKTITPLPY